MRKFLKISWIVLRSILLFIFLTFTTCVIVEHISKDILEKLPTEEDLNLHIDINDDVI